MFAASLMQALWSVACSIKSPAPRLSFLVSSCHPFGWGRGPGRWRGWVHHMRIA